MNTRTRWQKSNISKSLNDSNVDAFLDRYFEDFKHNLRDNNFEKMDMLLVNNIIDKFAIIFRMWDENRIFQASVDKKRLENIHKLMTNVFDARNDRSYEPTAANDFTLECNHCGEPFTLRNDNCRYSYDLHAISKEHRDFVGNLNLSESDTDESTVGDTGSCCNDEIVLKMDRMNIACEMYDRYNPDSDDSESTEICTIGHSSKPSEAVPATSNPVTTEISDSKNYSISVFNASCIVFDNDFLRCKLCSVKFQLRQQIIFHMKGKKHNKAIRKLEETAYVNFMVEDVCEVHCNVCNGYRCKNFATFLRHCRSNDHKKRAKQSNIELITQAVEHEIAEVLHCPVPECSSSESEFKEFMQHLLLIHQIK